MAEICHRLDGLPLAIELAAARIRLLPPPALLARLDRRLPLLVGGARNLPARQQTLRAAIAWSHDLLEPVERTLLRRLAIFAGGCTLEAAETLCARAPMPDAQGVESPPPGSDPDPRGQDLDVLAALAGLVEKHLVQQQAQPDGEPRFLMLETIREFALEQLEVSGEAGTLGQRHASYYLALAEQAQPELRGPQQLTWLSCLEREHDNLRAALRWLLDGARGAEHGALVAGEHGGVLAQEAGPAQQAVRLAAAL